MKERDGDKVSDHATDLDKGYEADRTVIELTMRLSHKDSYTRKDLCFNGRNNRYI